MWKSDSRRFRSEEGLRTIWSGSAAFGSVAASKVSAGSSDTMHDNAVESGYILVREASYRFHEPLLRREACILRETFRS